MNSSVLTKIKALENVDLYKLSSTRDPTTTRHMKIFRYGLRRKWYIPVGMMLMTYAWTKTTTFQFQHVSLKTGLSDDSIRFNREFQRMRFLSEPQSKEGGLGISTLQSMRDQGVEYSLNPSRKDLTKKNPHYKYF